MGQPERAALQSLVESIADGSAIDWQEAEARASGEEQALIRQLRIVAEIATLHRRPPASSEALANTFAVHRKATAPAIGRWAHLDLIERIGGGAFGEVYRAWDRHLERDVALKLLHATDRGDEPFASRIVTEGRLLARVQHPNVVTVHGVAPHEGRVGLWMELVEGPSLEQLLQRNGPFSAREAALIGIDLCRALAALHRARLVHRDVKTQNVLREHGGRIVLMDLGLGRGLDLTRAPLSDLAGTPLYLAPEILAGASAGERTDLYSLGVLLYRLVTAAFPVHAANMEDLQAAHAERKSVRLRDARADLPAAFVRVVDRATASDPEKRYGSAGEFEADLAATLDGTPAALPSSTARERRVRRLRPVIGWSAGALVAAIGVALALAAVPWSALRRTNPSAINPDTIRSIAVLPLANLSGDPAQEYFADALTDEVIGTIGQLGGVNVISRTSAMQFKGSSKPLPDIARALNVDAVLEGSVLVTPAVSSEAPAGQKHVRVNARLIQAGTDTQLWDRTFEHVLTDIVALQREIAMTLAEGIHLQFAGAQGRMSTRPGTRNPEAQEAYLRGRSYLDNSARGRLVEARRSLERATRLDPDYAQAHAALAVCYVWLELLGVVSQQEARRLALAEARRALQLDPDLAEAHGALADVELYDWNWPSAEAAYRRALELNPNYTIARRNYAWYLAAAARLDDALQQARLAQVADPLSAEANGAVAMMLYFNRRYDEAIAEMRKAVALAPDAAQVHNGLARAYAAKQSYPEAVAEIQEAVRLSGDAPLYVGELARTYAAAGDGRRARELFARLQQMGTRPQSHVDAQVLGYIYAALGDKDRAFDLLERSVREHSPGIAWASVDPRLDPVRQDARFVTLIRRIGLQRTR